MAARKKRKRGKGKPATKPAAVKKNPVKYASVKSARVKKNPPRKVSPPARTRTPAKRPAKKRAAPAPKTKAKPRAARGEAVLGGFARVPVKDLKKVLKNYDAVLAKLAASRAKVAALKAALAEKTARGALRLEERKRERAEKRGRLKRVAEAKTEALAAENAELKKELVRQRARVSAVMRQPSEDRTLDVENQIAELGSFLAQDDSIVGRQFYMQYQIDNAQTTAERLTKERGEHVSLDDVLTAIAQRFGIQAREVFTAWHSPSLVYAA